MTKSQRNTAVIIAIVLLVILIGYNIFKNSDSASSKSAVKIGVITDLSKDFAYWGESTKAGMELAKKELDQEGFPVEFVIEDAQLDPRKSLDAAKKLVNVSKVDAVYSELNPTAASVSSFVKNFNTINIYNDAPVSLLRQGSNIYKTHIDYEEGCQRAAGLLQQRGVQKVGVLKINLEVGDLCEQGIRKVFRDKAFAQPYDPGTSDFGPHLLKLKKENIQALFNISPPKETFASLKNSRELGVNVTFVGALESASPEIIKQNSSFLEGTIFFGFSPSLLPGGAGFEEKLKKEFPDKNVSSYAAAALVYIHSKQLVRTFKECNKDQECVKVKMEQAPADPSLGFMGFVNRAAKFNISVQEWKNGQFVEIKQ